jgi:hypothetical protein
MATNPAASEGCHASKIKTLTHQGDSTSRLSIDSSFLATKFFFCAKWRLWLCSCAFLFVLSNTASPFPPSAFRMGSARTYLWHIPNDPMTLGLVFTIDIRQFPRFLKCVIARPGLKPPHLREFRRPKSCLGTFNYKAAMVVMKVIV